MKRKNRTTTPQRLHALTSLRFLAAAVVVLHHFLSEHVGVYTGASWRVPVGHALSFFFVLSGFVLAYVYPSLDGGRAVGRFFRARFARIWPLHIVTLLLVIVLLPDWFRGLAGGSLAGTFLSPVFWLNALLVHAWIPAREYFWSYNSVSWAVSTEMALYLCFPLLLYKWERTWHVKLLACFLLAVGVIAFCGYAHLPSGEEGGVGYLGLIAIGPLMRLFEFAFGMTMALAYQRIKGRYQPGKLGGTVVEAVAWGVLIGSFCILPHLRKICAGAPESTLWWIGNGGMAALAIGPFILVTALDKGFISRVLSRPWCVALGELSFAMYLLHQAVLRAYRWQMDISPTPPSWLMYTCLPLVILIGSHLLLVLVERPFRRLIGEGKMPSLPEGTWWFRRVGEGVLLVMLAYFSFCV